MTYNLTGKRIYVAGHTGMVGSALLRALDKRPVTEVITRTRSELDLTCQADVETFMADARPDAVIVAAARVGGIHANNTQPVGFLYDNLMIAANVIRAAAEVGVGKLLFLGSSCIYPKHAANPISEDALLSGPLEPTNQWYAVAKIAGIKLCQAYRRERGLDFIAANPTNLYGPNDNYDLQTAHVLPALLRKAHEAKLSGADTLTVWGSGTPRREFLHVDDLASACLFLMERYSAEPPINIGYGEDIAIADLARHIAQEVGFSGSLEFDASKPDGTPRKLIDSTTLRKLGWEPAISLQAGIAQTYAAYRRDYSAHN